MTAAPAPAPAPSPDDESIQGTMQDDTDLQAYASALESALKSTDGVDYGGGAWLDLYGKVTDKDGVQHVIRVNLTSHARTTTGAVDNLMEGVAHASKEYHLYPWDPREKAAPAQQQQAQRPAQGAPAQGAPAAAKPPAVPPQGAPAQQRAPAAPPPAAGGGAPAAAGSGNAPGDTGVFNVDYFVVKARDNDAERVDIAFWGTGRKYAEVTIVKKPAEAAALLSQGTGQAWTAEYFTPGARYTVALAVHWRNSEKLNKNQVPYKDVTAINLR